MTYDDPSHSIQCAVWGVISLLSLFFLIPNAVMLTIEVNKQRTVGCPKYKFLRIWSILTITTGLVYCIVNCVRYISGLCYITWYLSHASIRLQPVFLGNFQLSRLYYCFAARTEGMGANGYPRWVFVLMFAVSGICATSIAIPYGFMIPELCYIDPDYMYHAHYVPFSTANSSMMYMRTYVEIGVYIPWDLAIFLLFCFSVQSIARTQMTLGHQVHSDNVPNGDRDSDRTTKVADSVHSDTDKFRNSTPNSTTMNMQTALPIAVTDDTNSNIGRSPTCSILGKIIPIPPSDLPNDNITSASGLTPIFRTLYRVLTVTLFYEMACVVVFIVNNVAMPRLLKEGSVDPWLTIGELCLITIWTLAAHLMIDDNERSYRHFIVMLHSTKLHYLCCCYRGLVEWQIKDLRQQQNQRQETHTVQLKSGAPELPDNGSYNTCTDTAELERNRTLNREFLNRIREENAETRIVCTQKEGQ